ncbi:MAG TPA: glycosyltransferase family 1 protein [Actinomycetota bacterium]|nr:glycosyltransferase family 1 protein [Actinomycetota bacterium]
MRVAFHVDQLWSSAPGGIGTYVWELVEAFDAMAEPELTLFRSRVDGAPARRFGREHEVVEIPWPIRRLYPSWNLVARPPLPERLATADVLHATNPAAVPPAADGQGLVVTVHDLAFDRFPQAFPAAWRTLYRTGARAAVRRADVLLVPTHATEDDLIDRGADPDRIRVTPLASSLPAANVEPGEVAARHGVDGPFVLCPGTLEPRKNQVRLIRAYRQLARDVPHALVLAGPDGWLMDEVDAELARPGPGTIVRTGRLDAEELDALYRAADLVAYPSLYEGFGLAIVEAMARGVPVVTSTAPACAEVAGDAAILVDPLDVGGLADALARALTDDDLRADLVARGRDRAATFSWNATAEATLDAYRDAVAGTARTAVRA